MYFKGRFCLLPSILFPGYSVSLTVVLQNPTISRSLNLRYIISVIKPMSTIHASEVSVLRVTS